jgi:transcriptional pleiotropic regulator of transition state genes
MKATGIVRKLDNLGRIVIPIELRRNFDIDIKDSLEIFVEGNTIVLKKYEPICTFCGESKDIFTFEGKNICRDCARKIKMFTD